MTKIPVSAVVVTRNEAQRIEKCLNALAAFDDIVVVDSGSTDATAAIARAHGARVFPFYWNGRYPKKRQWCLDNLPLAHDRVFFVDADEVVTRDLAREIANVKWDRAGYFVSGRYLWNGRALRFGLRNRKLALLDRRKMEFPVVDDLGLPGMGEIEGHYQPVLKRGFEGERIGALRAALLHDAQGGWEARHVRYAAWERGMNARGAWPADPSRLRQLLKKVFRALPFRALAAFAQCYVFRLGFLDGAAGLDFARSRARYYTMISAPSTGAEKPAETATAPPAPHR